MLTAQIESFEKALPELQQCFPRHWEELALFKDHMPLFPQYQEYIRREREGILFLATLRWDGKIVGYYTVQVAPGFHYGTTLTGHMDMVYIVPELRDRGLGFPLFRCVERELRRRGVGPWYSGYKVHNPLGLPEFLTALGFQPADNYMVKWLGDR